MRVGYVGEWIHVYVWLSPFAVHLRLSQHCYHLFLNTKLKKKNLKDPSLTQMLLFWFLPFLGGSWFAKNYTILSKVEEGADQFLMLGICFMLHCNHCYLLGQAWRQW